MFVILSHFVILSGAETSRSEVSAESKDPYTLPGRYGRFREFYPNCRLRNQPSGRYFRTFRCYNFQFAIPSRTRQPASL
jgi:hypothetical protein